MFHGKKAFLYVGVPFVALHLILVPLFYQFIFQTFDTDLRCAYIALFVGAAAVMWFAHFSVTAGLGEAEGDAAAKLQKAVRSGYWVDFLVVLLLGATAYCMYEICALRHDMHINMVNEQLKCILFWPDLILCGICCKAWHKSQHRQMEENRTAEDARPQG